MLFDEMTLNFVEFNPLQNNNPIAVRRRKLIAKIDEEIQLAQTKTTRPRSINGLLMMTVSKSKLKLPSVLSVGEQQALMERLILLSVMEVSRWSLLRVRKLLS